jgi:hypothetical protein
MSSERRRREEEALKKAEAELKRFHRIQTGEFYHAVTSYCYVRSGCAAVMQRMRQKIAVREVPVRSRLEPLVVAGCCRDDLGACSDKLQKCKLRETKPARRLMLWGRCMILNRSTVHGQRIAQLKDRLDRNKQAKQNVSGHG